MMKEPYSQTLRSSKPVWFLIILASLLLAACQPIQPVPDDTPSPSAEIATGIILAFVREGTLYIHTDVSNGEPVEIDQCVELCHFYHLQWSPDGESLLYHKVTFDSSGPAQIRLATRNGTVQTVAENVGLLRPASWSPTGDAFLYLIATNRYSESVEPAPGQGHVHEVWTAGYRGDGTVGERVLRGELVIGEGCGGGGRSESANAYEFEGGFAYGYAAGIVEWTAGDLLLYSYNCGSRGVGRFDLATGDVLDSYEGLRSLSLNAGRTDWVAIDAENRIVTGTPSNLETEVILTESAPELVFFGGVSGDIYYTTLEITGFEQLLDESAALEEINISPNFDFTRPELRRIGIASMQDALLWTDDGYAYARVVEGSAGNLFFSRVQNNSALYEALKAGEVTTANVEELLPRVDIFGLSATGAEPALVLQDAHQYALAERAAVAN